MESYIKTYCYICKKETVAIIVRTNYSKHDSEIKVNARCKKCGEHLCRIFSDSRS